MRSLKEMGISIHALKRTCKVVNELNLVNYDIQLENKNGKQILVDFINTIDDIPEENIPKITSEIKEFYDTIPNEVFNKKIDEKELNQSWKIPKPVIIPTSQKGTCSKYTTGWNPVSAACKECYRRYILDYRSCKRMVKKYFTLKEYQDAKSGKCTERKMQRTRGEKVIPKRTRYHHLIQSVFGCFDDCVWEGMKASDIIKRVCDWHRMKTQTATTVFHTYLSQMKNQGVVIVKGKDGIYKSDQEYALGQEANNTILAEPVYKDVIK